jgi:hypothetical protein
MSDPTPPPAFDFTKVFSLVAAVVKFSKDHPEAMSTLIAFAELVKTIIAEIEAANAPKS